MSPIGQDSIGGTGATFLREEHNQIGRGEAGRSVRPDPIPGVEIRKRHPAPRSNAHPRLDSALTDLIHATAITLALSELMTPGEVLLRPSLAAGNDPSRPYDVETDRRFAEFKLLRWDGSDAMCKRQVFKDLVHLAADTSGRRAELYVLGTRPLHFLQETRPSAAWGLDRSPATRTLFEERFGRLDVPIWDFTNGSGSHVTILNLEEQLPDLFAPL